MTWRTLAALGCVAMLAGCGSQPTPKRSMKLTVAFTPAPPKVGPAAVRLTLATLAGEPVKGAKIRLEGNMSHPGMTPVFANLAESTAGTYGGTIDFTMAGDWTIFVTGTRVDGSAINESLQIKGIGQP
jgi:hypothetical protein